MRHRLTILLVCAAALVACRNKQTPSRVGVLDLIQQGQHDQALAVVEKQIGSSTATAQTRDLHVALLAWAGRTPEAMDAYAARSGEGAQHDAVLLEAVMLSSYPPPVRLDPALLVDPERRPAYGTATHAALTRLIGPDLKGQVPRSRLVDLTGLLVVSGRDASLDALEEMVIQKTEATVRMTALMGFATVGTDGAVERLEKLAQEFQISNLMLRQILEVIRRIPGARPDLAVSMLESENDRVRAMAAGALVQSENPATDKLLASSKTIEATAALLGRGSADEEAAVKLMEHLQSLDTPLKKARFLDLLRETAGDAMVEPACTLARDEDPGTANNAVNLLGRIGHVSATPCLVQATRRQEETVRRTALKVLISVQAPDSIGDLKDIVKSSLASDDLTSATLATAAIGRAGGPEAEQILTGLVESDKKRIRIAAALGLFHLGHDEARPIVEEIFEEEKGPWEMLEHLEWILIARDPDDRAMHIVRRAIIEGNPSLREKTLGAIMDGLHPESVLLLEKVQLERYANVSLEFRSPGSGKVYGFTREVLKELDEKGDADGRRALLERLLDSEDTYLRALGLRCIGLRDGQWAVDRAMSVLRDAKDPWLRLEAVRALAIIEATRQVEKGGAQ